MADLRGSQVLETGVASGWAVLPGPPAMWSYSSLKDVETCPLRYALSRADYPGPSQMSMGSGVRGDVPERVL